LFYTADLRRHAGVSCRPYLCCGGSHGEKTAPVKNEESYQKIKCQKIKYQKSNVKKSNIKNQIDKFSLNVI